MNVLPLKYPITCQAGSLRAFAMRDFTLRDLKWLRGHPVVKVDRAFMVELLCKLSDLPVEIVEQLDLEDYVQAAAVATQILEKLDVLLPPDLGVGYLMNLAIEVMEATDRTSAEVFSMPLATMLKVGESLIGSVEQSRSDAEAYRGLH